MSFFAALTRANQMLFELGWRAGYKARQLDEARTARRIYEFEADPAPTALARKGAIIPGAYGLRDALTTIIALSVQYEARASERYARKALAELEDSYRVLEKELEQYDD